MPQPYLNTVLNALTPEVIDRLHLQPFKFELADEIEFPGKAITHLYFVETGMVSMTASFKDGSQVEVCMFGYESIIGVSALMGTKRSLNRAYTQIPGHGYSCRLETALKEFVLHGAFHDLCLRYVQAQLLQAMQSAGCNAKHQVEQRFARWLLLCADRVHCNTFKMSHEFLAHMLGTSRPTVTTVAGIFKDAELIEYSRGVIHLLDTEKLEARACECYKVIKTYLHNYAEFDSGIVT